MKRPENSAHHEPFGSRGMNRRGGSRGRSVKLERVEHFALS